MPVNPRIAAACVLLLSAATYHGANAASPSRARCNPDWTVEERTTDRVSRSGDPHYLLKKAGVRAEPGELLEILESDAELNLRLQALSAISYCDFRETQTRLEGFLRDPASGNLRELLVSVLLHWGSEAARAHVRSIVTNPSNNDALRLEWYPQHLRYGGECDLDFLRRTVRSGRMGSRLMAVQAVASLLARPEYKEEGMDLMRKLLRDSEAKIRSFAYQHLYFEVSRLERADLCLMMTEAVDREAEDDVRKTAEGLLQQLRALKKCVQAAP